MNEYDFAYIEKLRIHELRDYARRLGVNSPTTMKKEELISRINAIIETNPFAEKSIGGAGKQDGELDFFQMLISEKSDVFDKLISSPKEKESKTDSHLQDENKTNTIVMKTVSYDNNTPYQIDNFKGFSFKLAQNKAQYDANSSNSVYNVSGFVDIHPNGYGILRNDGYVPSDRDSYLTTSILKKYKLKKGHYIQGKAKFIMENKPKVVFEIEQIEDCSKVKNCIAFEELTYNGLGEEYYLEKFDISLKRGERHYIKEMSLKDAVDLGFDLVDENGVNVKLINVKARPEEEYASHQKMEVVNIPFNKSEIEVVSAVQLVLERIKREMEMGKSNVLMIYNFSDLIRIFNIACSTDGYVDFGKMNVSALNKLNNILYIAKNIDKTLSSSVICIDRRGVLTDLKTVMEIEFLPIFNNVHENISKK